MLNLQQEVQALLAKGENLGPGVFDAIADDIEKLTTQIIDLRKKSQPTTAADTESPEAEVKESTPLSLEGLYKEIKAVPGSTGLGNKDNEDVEMYEFLLKLVSDSMNREWKTYIQNNPARPNISRHTEYWSFMIGMAKRINERINELMKAREIKIDSTGTDLVIKNNEKDFLITQTLEIFNKLNHV